MYGKWFKTFTIDDFYLKDQYSAESNKVAEEVELDTLLNEDSHQSKKNWNDHWDSHNKQSQNVSNVWKWFRYFGNYLQYELFACGTIVKQANMEGMYYILSGNGKCFDNPKRTQSLLHVHAQIEYLNPQCYLFGETS